MVDRARRGGSGALYPQSALAGLNSLPRGTAPGQRAADGVDGRVPRDVGPRTRSGPEGSSLKRSPAGAAGSPGRSRRRRTALGGRPRRRVHGPFSRSAPRVEHATTVAATRREARRDARREPLRVARVEREVALDPLVRGVDVGPRAAARAAPRRSRSGGRSVHSASMRHRAVVRDRDRRQPSDHR